MSAGVEWVPSHQELHRMREWFDAVQDMNPELLELRDYEMARNVYRLLGMRVPHSILQHCTSDTPPPATEGGQHAV